MTRIAVVAVLVLGACFPGGGEPVPKALRAYLDAIIAQDYRSAYDRTQLETLVESFGPGASLTFEHFEAFYERDPLREYTVADVTRLERRTIDAATERGSPFWVADVTLVHQSGSHRETFHVEGEVLGSITVEPTPVRIRAGASNVILVDGVASRVAEGDADELSVLLMLQGSHTVAVEGAPVTEIVTGPLRVRSGPGRIEAPGEVLVLE